MGKRELVLIAVFVALGFIVYQVTAPPPPPGSEGISLSGIFRNMKRGVQGARESATADSTLTVPVDAAVKELRLNIVRPGDLTVAGEDRADIAAELHTTARGYDQAEAKASADATKLKIERVGDAMVVLLDSSAARTLQRNNYVPQMVILLRVPRRMAMRMEPHSGRLIVSHLASGEIMGSRGETRISGIPGRLVLTHSGGSLELEEILSLSDRILVIYEGAVIGEADPRTTSRDRLGLMMAGIRDDDQGEQSAKSQPQPASESVPATLI